MLQKTFLFKKSSYLENKCVVREIILLWYLLCFQYNFATIRIFFQPQNSFMT